MAVTRYPDILKDSEVLYEKCRVAELAKIAKVLESYTQRSFFSHQFTKAKNVNILVKAFEGSNFVQEQVKTKRHILHTPRSLLQSCKAVILSKSYPTICLPSLICKCSSQVHEAKMGKLIKGTIACNHPQECDV